MELPRPSSSSGGEADDDGQVLVRVEEGVGGKGQQQADLRNQHPAAAAAEEGQAHGVHYGRPDEFPSKRQTD